MLTVLALTVVVLMPAAPARSLAPADPDEIQGGPDLPDDGALFGAFVAVNSEHAGATNQEAQENFEASVGRTMVVDKEGHPWDEIFPSPYAYWSRDRGRIVAFEWNAEHFGGPVVKWADIADGDYDDDIDVRARAIKAFAAPAFFVFHHEPEDEVGQAGTTRDFVDAYRHVVDRFRAKGVTNLSYALVLLASTYRFGDPDLYYPGDSYVDLLGADGFNWHGCPGRDEAWTDFATIFGDFRDYGVSKRKPLYISEWGSKEDNIAGRKAEWFADAADTIQSWPEVKVVAYYQNGPPAANCDWWVDSSPSSLDAYQDMGGQRYFNPPVPPPNDSDVGAYIGVDDFQFSIMVGEPEQGKSIHWLFNGPSLHTVTENHGMGLFDSGSNLLGDTFTFSFRAAGNYSYRCILHRNMTGLIKVPLLVSPASGGLDTRFTVTWASAAPQLGFVYDVQVQRPRSEQWEDWKDGVTTTKGTFEPDAGRGTYLFRSRVRNWLLGASSWYSAEVSITVS